MPFLPKFLKRASDSDQDVSSEFRTTGQFFYIMVSGGVGIVVLHKLSLGAEAISLLWGLASFASGAAIGFLFGIPKILQGPGGSRNGNKDNVEAQQYQQQVNTNLTEISDWLTKIIVGLSLINLKVLPHYLVRLSDTLASSLGSGDVVKERPFALAIVVFFGVIGFLFGYLSTRLFLAGAFLKADTSQLRNVQAELQVQIASLQNSQGLVSASFANASGVQEAEVRPPQGTEQGVFDERLLEMATQYMDIESPNWGERVRLKDAAADQMGNYVLKMGISRDLIVDEARSTSNGTSAQRKATEGLVLALATVVNFSPEQGDFFRLMKVASLPKSRHVQYRMVLAFSRLFQGGQATLNDKDEILRVLALYEKDADASLKKLILNTRLSIESLTATSTSL